MEYTVATCAQLNAHRSPIIAIGAGAGDILQHFEWQKSLNTSTVALDTRIARTNDLVENARIEVVGQFANGTTRLTQLIAIRWHHLFVGNITLDCRCYANDSATSARVEQQ